MKNSVILEEHKHDKIMVIFFCLSFSPPYKASSVYFMIKICVGGDLQIRQGAFLSFE